MAKKQEIVCLTKIDAVDSKVLAQEKKVLEKMIGQPVFTISSLTRQGIQDLLTTLLKNLQDSPSP